jgi:hypothetical protein
MNIPYSQPQVKFQPFAIILLIAVAYLMVRWLVTLNVGAAVEVAPISPITITARGEIPAPQPVATPPSQMVITAAPIPPAAELPAAQPALQPIPTPPNSK